MIEDAASDSVAVRTPGRRAAQGHLRHKTPNFFIIGAAKSGTTSLWQYLSQHPQIYMHPQKQLNYFACEGTVSFLGPPPHRLGRYAARSWEEYCAEFAEAEDRPLIGEACNAYLYSPVAAARISTHIPDAKLVAVLRHPAQRAYSRYLQLVRAGREPLTDFGAALAAEKERIAADWWPEFHYLKVGLYHEQLDRYMKLFPREQIKVYLYDDLLADPGALLGDLFGFLGVRQDFRPDTDIRYSVSGLPRSPQFDWLLQKLRIARPTAERFLTRQQLDRLLRIAGRIHNYNLVKPRIEAEVRQRAVDAYREDTLRLQDLIGRDLSEWLK